MSPICKLKTDDVMAAHPIMQRIVAWCCVHGVHPNAVTLAGLAIAILIIPLHGWARDQGMTGACLVLFAVVLRQLLDVLDGQVARVCGKMSSLGGILDAGADAVMVTSVIYMYLLHVSSISSTVVRLLCAAAVPCSVFLLIWLFARRDHSDLKDPKASNCLVALSGNNAVLVIVFLYLPIFIFQLNTTSTSRPLAQYALAR